MEKLLFELLTKNERIDSFIWGKKSLSIKLNAIKVYEDEVTIYDKDEDTYDMETLNIRHGGLNNYNNMFYLKDKRNERFDIEQFQVDLRIKFTEIVDGKKCLKTTARIYNEVVIKVNSTIQKHIAEIESFTKDNELAREKRNIERTIHEEKKEVFQKEYKKIEILQDKISNYETKKYDEINSKINIADKLESTKYRNIKENEIKLLESENINNEILDESMIILTLGSGETNE